MLSNDDFNGLVFVQMLLFHLPEKFQTLLSSEGQEIQFRNPCGL